MIHLSGALTVSFVLFLTGSNTATEEISRNKTKLTFRASLRATMPLGPILFTARFSLVIVLFS